MSSAYRIPAVDTQPVEGGRRCKGCQRVKRLGAFDGTCGRCRVCVRLIAVIPVFRDREYWDKYRKTAAGKKCIAKHRQTPLGKLGHRLTVARRKLRVLDAGPPYPKWMTCRDRDELVGLIAEYERQREELRAESADTERV